MYYLKILKRKLNILIIILKEFQGIKNKFFALFYFFSFSLQSKGRILNNFNMNKEVIVRNKVFIQNREYKFFWKLTKGYRMDYMVVSSFFEKNTLKLILKILQLFQNPLFVDIGNYI